MASNTYRNETEKSTGATSGPRGSKAAWPGPTRRKAHSDPWARGAPTGPGPPALKVLVRYPAALLLLTEQHQHEEEAHHVGPRVDRDWKHARGARQDARRSPKRGTVSRSAGEVDGGFPTPRGPEAGPGRRRERGAIVPIRARRRGETRPAVTRIKRSPRPGPPAE